MENKQMTAAEFMAMGTRDELKREAWEWLKIAMKAPDTSEVDRENCLTYYEGMLALIDHGISEKK